MYGTEGACARTASAVVSWSASIVRGPWLLCREEKEAKKGLMNRELLTLMLELQELKGVSAH